MVISVKSHATLMCKKLCVENLVILYSTVVITALVSVDVATKVVCTSAAGQSVSVSKLVDTYVISHALQTAHHAWRNATTTVCIADVSANATNVVCLVQSRVSGSVSISSATVAVGRNVTAHHVMNPARRFWSVDIPVSVSVERSALANAEYAIEMKYVKYS